jgi:hypothetical protein
MLRRRVHKDFLASFWWLWKCGISRYFYSRRSKTKWKYSISSRYWFVRSFAISADERYGPIYNQGIARAIVKRMNAAHPIAKSQQKVKLVLIGTSGGVQVALGAASHLDEWLNADLIVVSVGGAFDGNTGSNAVNNTYHLQGRRDWVEDISRFVFASRWRSTVGSPFNQARNSGRYTVIVSGPHTHNGAEGYFGQAFVGESKTTFVKLTLQQVNQLPIWSEPKSSKSR